MFRFALTVALSFACFAPAAESPPNVLLIVSDDQAYTDYGFMKHPHVATPHLDKLASQSLLFRRGTVPSSLCCPSLATLLTGLYPHQHRITSNDPPNPMKLRGEAFQKSAAFREGRATMNAHLQRVPTIPATLSKLGYLTLQTGKFWQGDFHNGGFTHGMSKGSRHGDEGLKIGRATMQPVYDHLALAQREQKPWMVWYAPMMPHEPHNPPEALFAKYRKVAPTPSVAKYWAMCEWFDQTCGDLLKHLDDRNLAKDTIVIYMADNGWIQNQDGNGYIRSKRTPFEAGLRTPIMIRYPAKLKPRVDDTPVSSVDIFPTLLALLSQTKPPVPKEFAMPGIDLTKDKLVKARPAIFGECFTHDAIDLNVPEKNLLERWMVQGTQKLIMPHGANSAEGVQLYDLANDPGEVKNLAGDNPAQVKKMRAMLDAWWKP